MQQENGALFQDEVFEYDKHGNRTKVTFKDGSTINYQYDSSD
jgi:hypothetical protein